MELNLKVGNRLREWDSCMIPDYGLVAGGHNFRPNKENRLKQRYRCKLKTFMDRFNTYACVGCGRCIETPDCRQECHIGYTQNRFSALCGSL